VNKFLQQFCGDCEHVTPTESQQDMDLRGKRPHRCAKYNEPLFHREMHPKLFKCQSCEIEEKNLERTCESCNKHETPECSRSCTIDNPIGWKPIRRELITFHRLNGLTPTLSSCTAKVYEEIGELMRLLGKGVSASGERKLPSALGPEQDSYADWVYKVIGEALDGAQALVTLIHTLADEHNVNVQVEIIAHEEKLMAKGYLVEK